MRSVIVVLLVIIGVCYGKFVISTTTTFMPTSKPNTVRFGFDIEQIPVPGSNYYAELELNFAEMFDEFTLTFEGQTNSFVAKEKGQKMTIVLSTISEGALAGWSYQVVRCGTPTATLTSSSKLSSATLKINLMNSVAPSCHKAHPSIQVDETYEEDDSFVGLIVHRALLAFASVFCLCCTISCIRRCAARRCCKKNYKPVEEAYPAEAIANVETADQFVGQENTQQQYVFPYPVMAVPINGDTSQQQQQYVQLMPVVYAQQQ